MADARGLRNDVRDLFRVEGLLEEAVSAAADGFERGLLLVAARDDDDLTRPFEALWIISSLLMWKS
ncbi:MAG: hypothetical protein LC802_20245 [Acidobacteria bacterium]|nr:hypothetical protein [Acidobacteriota bacterium]